MRVPFPHVERAMLVPRPALVLTLKPIGPQGLLLWTAMITNASRPPWPDDVEIKDAVALGLLIPSKVRPAKIFSVEASSATLLAKLDNPTMSRILGLIRNYLGLD